MLSIVIIWAMTIVPFAFVYRYMVKGSYDD